MAALDFPDNPATGDLYGSSGTVWRWDGARWASTAGASGARGRVAYAQTVADQGGFTTGLLNVAGLSVTYNGVAGRTYKITGWLMAKSPVAADIAQLILAEGSGTALNASNWAMPLVNLAYRGVVHHVYTAASTASQTIKLMYAGGNNGHTVVASPTNPAFILVEDITYEAGTSGVGIEPTAWSTVTPVATWGLLAGSQPPEWRKVQDRVEFRGTFYTTIALTANTWYAFSTIPGGATSRPRYRTTLTGTCGWASFTNCPMEITAADGAMRILPTQAFGAGSGEFYFNVSWSVL